VIKRARKTRLVGTAAYRDEGEPLLALPGDAVLIHRGQPRSIVMKCPDGCGETLVVNLDERAGKAWRLDTRGGTLTLYPSVWREGGCKSHFILWRGHILWCGLFERGNFEPAYDPALESRILDGLDSAAFKTPEAIAIELGEITWEVRRAADRLVLQGKAESGKRTKRFQYRLKRKAAPLWR
jgi:hypothetical protein